MKIKVEAENLEDSNIWSSILEQVQNTDTKKLPQNRTLLVLGDNETGKTSLIAKLAGSENPTDGSGLEYNFLEIKDEYRDETTKLGVWILDGDLNHAGLLKFSLTESTLENTTCMLVASIDKPWEIMNSLEKWANVIEEYIESLNIKPTKMKQLQQKLLFNFLNYVSPTDDAGSKTVLNKSIDLKSKVGEDQSTTNIFIATNNHDLSTNEDLPKDKLTYNKNLGIPLVVVITKTDHISTLEKDYDYSEETFDFIQQAVRKFCLRYGASLFYVSTKLGTNCELLHKYLAHIIYDLPFDKQASVIVKDAIFVPSGWDNTKKISILYDSIRSIDPEADYNEFVFERNDVEPTSREMEIHDEDDQVFLMQIQAEIGKQQVVLSGSSGTAQNVTSPVQQRQSIVAPIAGDGQAPSEGVLQNFFNSLLSNQRK